MGVTGVRCLRIDRRGESSSSIWPSIGKCSRKNDKMKYFDCSLTDGNDTCRLVSFDPHIRPELEDCMEKGQSVSLSNCEIKRAKGGMGLEIVEIVLSEKSRVTHSLKKFKVVSQSWKRWRR